MSLEERLPVKLETVELGEGNVGLVVVDAVVGFTRRGNLSDPKHMVPMVERINAHWKALHEALGERLHTLCFRDAHEADIPEPPYPPHCFKGTGEEELDPDLRWLLDEDRVVTIDKDCINGVVGAIDRETGRNRFCDWVVENDLRTLLVVGDCTDICVSDFVVTALSARNHGLLTAASLSDRERYVADIVGMRIIALADACETFDAPGHERAAAHHVGLWLMASRGAIIAAEWRA